ncbi:MAG: AI-2E family transporter [Exilibacterium sp.]
MLNFVPTLGSILAAIPPLLLALIQLGTGSALLTVLGYVVINVSIGNVLEPRIMGRGLNLSALVVLLSLVFWGWVLGPVGMLLSIPLTMTVKIAMESHEETRWIGVMLGSGNGVEARPKS